MGRVPNKWRCFYQSAGFHTTRCLYTKKMVVHFHLHWWVSPIISHSVLPFASGHMCREHKKRDVSFHYEEQVSPVQGTSVPYWPQWSFYSALMKELSFLNYPLLSTQIILWDFSNHRALYPGCFDSLRWGMSQINSACIKLQCGSETCIPQMFTAKTRVKGFMESMTG